MHRTSLGVASAFAVGLLLVLSGCGSSSTNSTKSNTATTSSAAAATSTAAASSGSSQHAALVAQVNAEEQRPTKIGPTEKIKGPIPTGKTIALVQCGVEDCIIQGNSLQQAADVLGWKLIRIPSGVTPETIKAGWDQALRDHPDAIVEGGFPHAYFKSEIAQALAEKIPVVGLTDPDPIAPPVIQNIGSQVYLTRLGQLFANWVGAHVQSGQIGQVTTSDLPTEVRQAGSFKARLAVVCPKCTIKTQNIPISTFGTTSAATIAGFYQANPNLAYSAMALADMGVGLPQALAGANVTAPLTVYASANPVTLGYMAKHQANLQADIVYSTVEVPWRAADALVRYWTHGDVSQDSDLTLPNWYLTPPNIPAAALKGPIPWVANYQQQYKALWGK